MRRLLLPLLAMLLAAAVVACGDDTETAAPTTSTSTTTTTTQRAAPPTTSGPTPMDESTTTTEAVVASDRTGDLAGRWLIQAYLDREGVFGDVTVRGAAPELTFAADGSLVFHTGCNRGDTTFSTTGVYDGDAGQAITIEPGIAEEAGCDFGLGEQNVALPAAWQQSASFVLDGDTLVLRAADGTELVIAERA
ncbi:MAG: META domain-containing protein [Actinomycetota bacterium]